MMLLLLGRLADKVNGRWLTPLWSLSPAEHVHTSFHGKASAPVWSAAREQWNADLGRVRCLIGRVHVSGLMVGACIFQRPQGNLGFARIRSTTMLRPSTTDMRITLCIDKATHHHVCTHLFSRSSGTAPGGPVDDAMFAGPYQGLTMIDWMSLQSLLLPLCVLCHTVFHEVLSSPLRR